MRYGIIRDERQLIYRLLKRLPKAVRVNFLRWCCQKVSDKFQRTDITNTTGEAADIFWDIMSLKVQFGLDLEIVGQELERLCRRSLCCG